MLAIDDLKKLADMQIHLLKMTSKDRVVNLEKYKDLVIQIDKYAFEKFLLSLDQVSAHNQSLEVELQYLEQIRENYQQLLEQQLLYRKNCELYGDAEIQLSDLSILNIDYIDSRINTINGYLINKLNLENCREKIENLNNELLLEEKNKNIVFNRLLQLEEELRNNFVNAEGRVILDGQLKYISIVSEYNELGFDVKELLEKKNKLDELLLALNEEMFDVEEKLNVAEICYKSDSNSNNMRIFNEIKLETLRVRYKVSMLKILDLLSLNYGDYNLFKKKREDLLSLINYRLNCLKGLGIHISIDPFSRIKIAQQMEVVSSFGDSTENICRIKREISELDASLECLSSRNSEYMIQLSNTKDVGDLLLKAESDEVSLVDIENTLDLQIIDTKVLDNQVVSVRDVSKELNIGIVSQKTNNVIKRVNEMVNSVQLSENLINKESDDVGELSPELVIVEDKIDDVQFDLTNDESLNFVDVDSVDLLFDNFSLVDDEVDDIETNKVIDEANVFEMDVFSNVGLVDEMVKIQNDDIDVESEVLEGDEIDPILSIDEETDSINSEIFSTVDPFLETSFFDDRIDDGFTFSVVDNIVEDDFLSENDSNIQKNDVEFDSNLAIDDNKIEDLKDEMPDAFWVVEDENKDETKEEVVLSFDEQVDKLLAEEDKVKTRRLAA